MLVLSRNGGERVVVPEYDLAVTVIAVEGNKVRLGISAPAQVAVYREDVWQTQTLSKLARRRISNALFNKRGQP